MCCTTLFFTAVFRSYMNQSCKLLRQIFNKVQNEKKIINWCKAAVRSPGRIPGFSDHNNVTFNQNHILCVTSPFPWSRPVPHHCQSEAWGFGWGARGEVKCLPPQCEWSDVAVDGAVRGGVAGG